MTKFKQIVGWVAMALAILGLTVFMSAGRAAADTSAPADPTGDTAPSELGKYWQFIGFSGVTQNGMIAQPNNQNVVATSGSSMDVPLSFQATNDNGICRIGHSRRKRQMLFPIEDMTAAGVLVLVPPRAISLMKSSQFLRSLVVFQCRQLQERTTIS
ncbi:hypothetical protein [Secundilactobacillus kimchicus]|uniref:hypothetical protein n=1 Tax=Secundilactobacillus kimchicus TaxID=528209 RepID=UPI0006D1EDE4|nr:hypothetical protein [Secundilactobacillus kimchicus]